NDEPAKGTFFVPGGGVRKNETLEDALDRIALRETGLRVRYSEARFRGVYQHFYRATRSRSDGPGTHYVVLAHDIAWPEGVAVKLDDSHSVYRWMTEAEILACGEVHEYTKDYFRPARRTHHAAM